MTEPATPTYLTRRIGPADPACGFRCGKHPFDDYFRRHALPNDQGNIGLAYVVDASPDDIAAGLPTIIVDAKDEDAERFYEKYDFVTVDASSWPHRMFLPIDVARAAFRDE